MLERSHGGSGRGQWRLKPEYLRYASDYAIRSPASAAAQPAPLSQTNVRFGPGRGRGLAFGGRGAAVAGRGAAGSGILGLGGLRR